VKLSDWGIIFLVIVAIMVVGTIIAYAGESCAEKCYRIHGQTLAGDRCAAQC
jgi:hypothetical protein